jgi:hypothetical protein
MDNILELAGRFALPGAVASAAPFGNGHINSTYLLSIEGAK